MHVKKSKESYTLYRYGGTEGGKSLEVRIDSVAAGTMPDAVPDEVKDNLTPRELRELSEILERDYVETMRLRVAEITRTIDDLAANFRPEFVDPETGPALANAVSGLGRVIPQFLDPKSAAKFVIALADIPKALGKEFAGESAAKVVAALSASASALRRASRQQSNDVA